MPRAASRFDVKVADALTFEEPGAFRRWVSISRVIGSGSENPFAASKMSVQDELFRGDQVGVTALVEAAAKRRREREN